MTFSVFSEGQFDDTYVQRNYEFTGFNSLSVNGAFRIRVLEADTWDILISCSREDINNVKLRKNGEFFEISYKQTVDSVRPSPVLIISMPELLAIRLAGAVQMEAGGFSSSSTLEVRMEPGAFLNLNGFESSLADFTLSGPCELHAFLSAETINITNEGSSIVRMGGRAENLHIQSQGRSKIDGTLLLVDNVFMQLSGLCEIRITPDVQMNVNSSDKAVIYYSDKYMDQPPVAEGNAILRKY